MRLASIIKESKMRSVQWKHRSYPTTKKTPRQKNLHAKLMAAVSWDLELLLLLELMPHKTTMIEEICASIVIALWESN